MPIQARPAETHRQAEAPGVVAAATRPKTVAVECRDTDSWRRGGANKERPLTHAQWDTGGNCTSCWLAARFVTTWGSSSASERTHQVTHYTGLQREKHPLEPGTPQTPQRCPCVDSCGAEAQENEDPIQVTLDHERTCMPRHRSAHIMAVRFPRRSRSASTAGRPAESAVTSLADSNASLR
jgi:hypothetical protein